MEDSPQSQASEGQTSNSLNISRNFFLSGLLLMLPAILKGDTSTFNISNFFSQLTTAAPVEDIKETTPDALDLETEEPKPLEQAQPKIVEPKQAVPIQTTVLPQPEELVVEEPKSSEAQVASAPETKDVQPEIPMRVYAGYQSLHQMLVGGRNATEETVQNAIKQIEETLETDELKTPEAANMAQYLRFRKEALEEAGLNSDAFVRIYHQKTQEAGQVREAEAQAAAPKLEPDPKAVAMREIAERITDVENSDLSPEQRQEQIQALQREVTQILRGTEAVGAMKIVQAYENGEFSRLSLDDLLAKTTESLKALAESGLDEDGSIAKAQETLKGVEGSAAKRILDSLEGLSSEREVARSEEASPKAESNEPPELRAIRERLTAEMEKLRPSIEQAGKDNSRAVMKALFGNMKNDNARPEKEESEPEEQQKKEEQAPDSTSGKENAMLDRTQTEPSIYTARVDVPVAGIPEINFDSKNGGFELSGPFNNNANPDPAQVAMTDPKTDPDLVAAQDNPDQDRQATLTGMGLG